MSYFFTCPECGNNQMEEVMVNVTVISKISDCSRECLEYGEQTNEVGDFDRYRCCSCGWTIPANNPEELAEFLAHEQFDYQSRRMVV